MIKMIWAMDESNLIGSNNKMPWHVKEDLIYFKNMTKDYSVVMGYNTYLSMLYYYKDKPFPYKNTFVLTSKKIEDDRVITFSDVSSFVKNTKEDIFVTGGKQTYLAFYPYASELYVTLIKGVHEGDTYMDNIDSSQFELVSKTEGTSGLATFCVYKRV